MGVILRGILLSIVATLLLLTASILMRTGDDGGTAVISIAGEIPPARGDLADVR